MPRTVRFDATTPIKIDPATWPRDEAGNMKVLSICACGISAKFPFCDGAHKSCKTEEPGCTYTYDIATRAVLTKSEDALGAQVVPKAQENTTGER
jgi:CDGSH-type Zn-finger protein